MLARGRYYRAVRVDNAFIAEIPMDAQLVPISSTSRPGTAAISSALAIAIGVSRITIVRLAALSAAAVSPELAERSP
jgi:hypothetical protein